VGGEQFLRELQPPDAEPAGADGQRLRELERAHAMLVAQLEGRVGPTLSEAKRFALKKEAARAKAGLIRLPRAAAAPGQRG
jgi:hypothetical protein